MNLYQINARFEGSRRDIRCLVQAYTWSEAYDLLPAAFERDALPTAYLTQEGQIVEIPRVPAVLRQDVR